MHAASVHDEAVEQVFDILLVYLKSPDTSPTVSMSSCICRHNFAKTKDFSPLLHSTSYKQIPFSLSIVTLKTGYSDNVYPISFSPNSKWVDYKLMLKLWFFLLPTHPFSLRVVPFKGLFN